MAFMKKPVTGMRDILPEEKELREKLMHIIRATYGRYGFTEIETPVVEHIGNLTGKQGGDNEKLIFRILKRGDKLQKELSALLSGDAPGTDDIGAGASEDFADRIAADGLTEEGLRYDLTVPLCRYYSSNMAVLPQPFKALQMGPVFRADRPQKGRFRQFMQCDIDILGDATNLAEKELILATTDALDNIGFSAYNYYIVINDRRLLFALVDYAGFPAEDAMQILIVLDKADKIGAEGVDQELRGMGYSEEAIARLRALLGGCGTDAAGVRAFAQRIGTEAAVEAGESLADIMESVGGVSGRCIRLVFDPTLVRGMGYYTGTIFEIRTEKLGSSVGGGGRYDRMVGRFIGQDVPAVGFSIGFERIMTILLEDGADRCKEGRDRQAWLIEKGMPAARLAEVFNEAARERQAGHQVLMVWMAKNRKFQKESLEKQGCTSFRDIYVEQLRR